MSIDAKIVENGKFVGIHTFPTSDPGEAELISALGGDPDTDRFAHTLGTLAKKWEVLYLGSKPEKACHRHSSRGLRNSERTS